MLKLTILLLTAALWAEELPKDAAEREAIFKSGKCAQWITDHYNAVPCPIDGQKSEALQAEIVSLRADLAKLQIRFQYEMKVCEMPDMMRASLASQEAAAKLESARQPGKPGKENMGASAPMGHLSWIGGPLEWTGSNGRETVAMIVKGADGYGLYDQRGCETPERPCKLEALVKALDEAKVRASGW